MDRADRDLVKVRWQAIGLLQNRADLVLELARRLLRVRHEQQVLHAVDPLLQQQLEDDALERVSLASARRRLDDGILRIVDIVADVPLVAKADLPVVHCRLTQPLFDNIFIHGPPPLQPSQHACPSMATRSVPRIFP